MMKVILTKTVDHLGSIGDVVRVKNGYARNYLIPQGMALFASKGNQAELEHHKKILEKKRLQLVAHSQELADKLRGTELLFMKTTRKREKIYGTVTTKEIALKLEELGYEIPRKSLKIQGDAKSLGSYAVTVQLPQKVATEITIIIQSDASSDDNAATTESESHDHSPAGDSYELNEEELPDESFFS